MAAAKKIAEGFSEKDFDELRDHAATMTDERDRMFAVLQQVGTLIRTINTNGKQMNNLCRLCEQTRVLNRKNKTNLPCPHAEVWALTK